MQWLINILAPPFPYKTKSFLGEQDNELPNSSKQEPLTEPQKFTYQNDHEYFAKGEEFEIQKTIPSRVSVQRVK